MPEFTIKEVRLPEFHLPEIKRDEIVRSLSGARLPEVDLAKARRAKVKIPAMTVTSSDVGKLIAAVAAVVRLVRPAPSPARWLRNPFGRRSRSPVARIVQPRTRRSRWPFALGAIVLAAFGAWTVLRRPAVRNRIDAAARRARERFAELRARDAGSDVGVIEPIAFPAAETAPIEPEGFATATDDRGAFGDYPDGLGSNTMSADGIPAFEESGSSS